ARLPVRRRDLRCLGDQPVKRVHGAGPVRAAPPLRKAPLRPLSGLESETFSVTAAQAMAFLELPMAPPNAFKASTGLGELVVLPIRQAPSFTSRWRRLAHRFVGLYRATALLLLNVCVVILMLNGILFVYYRAKGDYGDPGHFTGPIDKYG